MFTSLGEVALYVVKLADIQLMVKCYDKKMVKSPFNWVIFPLTQLQVANQQQQQKNGTFG